MKTMIKPSGSWVAIPTPFREDMTIDFGVFDLLVEHHIRYGTNMLFCLGSAGEATMLTLEERHAVITYMAKLCKGRIPVFFGATMATTEATVQMARYAQAEGADGLIFTAPSYLLPPQADIREFLLTAMKAVEIPVGIYNNPSRTGVNISPETIELLAGECENFVVDKEAMGDVSQLVEVKRRLGERLNILCCDAPGYSILPSTLAIGGNGAANIGGNVIPEEMARMARPWTSDDIRRESVETYFQYYELLQALYWASNPIVIKAALRLLGFPVGAVRKPYQDLAGDRLGALKGLLEQTGVMRKYAQ